MGVRVVHLFPDSPFLPFIADVFEAAAPGSNLFGVFAVKGDLARHNLPPDLPVHVLAASEEGVEAATALTCDADVAIFHSVGAFAGRVMLATPGRVVRVWSGWGGDYYGSLFSPTAAQLGPLTSRFERRRRNIVGRIVTTARTVRSNWPVREAARAADIFSAPIPEDFAVFRERFPGFRGRYSQLNYASVEDTYSTGSMVSGDDILLGNSASPTNNHLEVLESLKQAKPSGRRIIAPLSYGDPAYADLVASRGRELFGAEFVPLRDFLPFAEYQRIISGCSVVLMGHRRQQGIGNVAAAMWAGARVVLDSRNPLHDFFTARGAQIETLQDAWSGDVLDSRIGQPALERNRRVLQSFWGRKTVLDNVRRLLASAL